MRWFLVVIFALVCTEAEPAQAEPVARPAPKPTKPTKATKPTKPKHTYGGDASPPYRDAQGRAHGPGGPLFMGRGADCTDKIDHCLRGGAWFSTMNIVEGKLFRGVPVFSFENAWFTYGGDPDKSKIYLKTAVANKETVKRGEPIVFLPPSGFKQKWINSEYDVLVSARWKVAMVDSIGAETVRVKGWDGDIPIDTVRVIVERE